MVRILPIGRARRKTSKPVARQEPQLDPQRFETAPYELDDVFMPHEAAEGWLTVTQVKKSYKKRMVVKGVSLDVRRGESVGLLGPNGAGKTTVFYMITGLVPADEGQITIDGHDVTALPMYQRAASESGTCLRKPRSFGVSRSKKTSWRCWSSWSRTRRSGMSSSISCWKNSP